MKLAATLAAAAFATLALAASTAAAAPSSPGDALSQACFARAKIGSETAMIAGQVIAPGTPANVRSQLQAIRMNLGTIRGTFPSLPPAVRRRWVAASTAFVRLLGRITPTLLRAPSGPAPPAQFARFRVASQLARPVFQRTFGQLAC